jgi:hypothetical protein
MRRISASAASAILIGYVLAPRTRSVVMLKWLRRILAVIAILIALSVLVPLAYIEGPAAPLRRRAAGAPP